MKQTALAVTIVAICAMPAEGHDKGQWESNDPAVRAWYRSLMQPDNPHVSCCGESDAYWADKVEVIGDKVFATITDDREDAPLKRRHIPVGTRYEIPPHKMQWKHGNPTGHIVIFINAADQVLCFVQGGGV